MTEETGGISSSTKNPKSSTMTPILMIIALIFAMIGLVAFLPDSSDKVKTDFGGTLHPANALATVSQCGGIYTFDPPREYYGRIPTDFFKNPYGEGSIKRTVPVQPMRIPAYGYFYTNRDEPPQKFYSFEDKGHIPKSFEYLSYMWKGWTIIWYDKNAGDQATSLIKAYVEDREKVMALPWISNDTPIPMERSFAYSAWGITESCGLWDDRAGDQFLDFVNTNSAPREQKTPPSALLDPQGELPNINVPR